MSKAKQKRPVVVTPAQMLKEISGTLPTMRASMDEKGRMLNVADNSVWVYFKVPTGSVADAKSFKDKLEVFNPLESAWRELAGLGSAGMLAMPMRRMQKDNYRRFKLQFTSLPQVWRPNSGHPELDVVLRHYFPREITTKRQLLLGIPLKSSTAGGGVRAAVESLTYTLVEGGTPISDFDADYHKVVTAMQRAGLELVSKADADEANAWWNHGNTPDTINTACADHVHVFSSSHALYAAERIGLDACEKWPELPDTQTISFASLADVDLPFIQADSAAANWLLPLIQTGAMSITVSGKVEPAKVTRQELRRQHKRIQDDITERENQLGARAQRRAEQDEKLAELDDIEGVYATGNGTPTLIDCSVVLGFDGKIEDYDTLCAESAATLRPMQFRQLGALAESMQCSGVTANTNLHDFPSQTITASGIQSLTKVGDREGVLRGFSELDRQPVWHSQESVYANEDSSPTSITVGDSGSGKSVGMQWEAYQTGIIGNPQVVFDPKQSSDFTPALSLLGPDRFRAYSLDRLAQSDGVFDPIRLAKSEETGVELAASMIATINPWGTEALAAENEPGLMVGLRYGVAAGADCTGEALRYAVEHEKMDPAIYKTVMSVAESSPMFGSIVGTEPGRQGLNVFDGTTLIKVGDANLNLPSPGQTAGLSISQRMTMAVIKQIVLGSAMALSMRRGVIRLDEAWVFLSSNPRDIDQLARVARSQQVSIELYTQKISDALQTGLKSFLSRGAILHAKDESEARAACDLMKLEPTPARLGRIGAKPVKDEETRTPNFASLRAIKNTQGTIVRGSVEYYMDVYGRVAPVEVKIPPEFARAAFTDAGSMDARKSLQLAKEPA